MEPFTIATAALTLATPYLVKTGEALAQKVGEEIWDLIKLPFRKKEKKITYEDFIKNQDIIKAELVAELERDPELQKTFVKAITEAQTKLEGNFQQNINSYGKIDKQINIQNNSGGIQM